MLLQLIIATVVLCALLWYVFYVLLPARKELKQRPKEESGLGDLDELLQETTVIAKSKKRVKNKIKSTIQAFEEADKSLED